MDDGDEYVQTRFMASGPQDETRAGPQIEARYGIDDKPAIGAIRPPGAGADGSGGGRLASGRAKAPRNGASLSGPAL